MQCVPRGDQFPPPIPESLTSRTQDLGQMHHIKVIDCMFDNLAWQQPIRRSRRHFSVQENDYAPGEIV